MECVFPSKRMFPIIDIARPIGENKNSPRSNSQPFPPGITGMDHSFSLIITNWIRHHH